MAKKKESAFIRATRKNVDAMLERIKKEDFFKADRINDPRFWGLLPRSVIGETKADMELVDRVFNQVHKPPCPTKRDIFRTKIVDELMKRDLTEVSFSDLIQALEVLKREKRFVAEKSIQNIYPH